MVHIKRFDAMWKIVLSFTQCIYWFNPAIWVFTYFSSRDLQISCDEHVLHQIGHDARAPYAMALIAMAKTIESITPAEQGFSRTALEERVTAIMHFKKTSICCTR